MNTVFTDNQFGTEGAIKIGEALKTNTSLTYLSITATSGGLSDEEDRKNISYTEFLKVLDHNSSLTELQLWIGCDDEYDDSVVWSNNQTMTELDLRGLFFFSFK